MSGGRSRRDRSRSPRRNSRNRRRENSKNKDSTSNDGTNDMPSNVINNMVNPMMMYSQGNMMMGGMYPNMIMQNSMMGGVMPNSGMEMMPNSGMEIMQQGSMDMSSMSGTVPPPPAPPMDMSMMGGMMMDASAMSMYSGMQAITGEVPVEDRKDIFLKNCKLSPPQPGSLLGPRRDKPLGCRTIFVGGLPDKIDEKTVREIFENYGVIQTLRLSTKNFCHIRFDRELCVDAAIALSGYHIKLTGEHENDDTKATTGILHVDYALSRDDQYDYERRQRSALRAQKEQIKQLTAQQKALQQTMNMDEMYNKPRSPSPIRIQSFSVAAVLQLAEKIKNEEQFANTLPTLIAWLERGDCSKKNSSQFYGMLQATNSHIRRLFNEKMQAEEELQECKERVKSHIEKVIEQLEQVAKVFTAATHQRVWDHFTKAQRKNIETWQKMTQEFNTLKEEFNEKFSNDEMDYNGANVYENNMDVNFATSVEIHKLKRENESLQFQLQAYQNEVAVIKADAQKEMDKFKAQFIARQALQQAFDQPPPLPETPAASKPPPPPPLPDDLKAEVEIVDEVEAGCGEAKLIGVMSAFLQVHPQGASLDYVVSYVRALFPQVTQATVHHVLKKHTDVFTCVTKGVGANIERRWSFTAFQNNQVQNTQVQNNEIQE